MTCQEFVDFLMAYLDAELPAAERLSFERHIADCPTCDTYLGQYEQTIKLGKLLCEDPEGPVPEDVPEPLVAAVLAARRSSAS